MSPELDDQTAFIQANEKDPLTLSICMLRECPALVRCNNNLYQFNGKYYDLITDKDIQRTFHNFIRKYGIVKAWGRRRDVIESINSMGEIPIISGFNNYPDLMCLNNCILNVHTKEQIPHSNEYYFDSFVNIDYEPTESDCPAFKNYLIDTFNGDETTIENIVRLGGYLLDSTTKAGKMFLFTGPGGSGKSTLIDTYTMFFHPAQITALSLEELASGSFDKEDLITSRFNQCAEAKKSYIDAEEIKKIVTGDLIKVSRKLQRAVTFRPKTKIIVACNGLPKFNDTSDGIYRRLILIEFTNQYRPQEEINSTKNAKYLRFKPVDFTLFDKIQAEKNAIFNLFLGGLQRLKTDNYQFVHSLVLDNLLSGFKRDSDTVREFLEENYEVDEKGDVVLLDIYNHYRLWYRQNVQDNSSMKFRANEMGRRIKEVFGVESLGQRKVLNIHTNTYQHLSLYPLRLKDHGDEINVDEVDFDTTQAVTPDQAGLNL